MRSPLRTPDLPRDTVVVVGLVSGSEFINHSYLVLFPPILGLLVAEFEVGLPLLGLAIGVQAATNALFQLPFGYLSDHADRRQVLGLSLGLSTASVFLIAAAPSFEVLLVGQALLGIGIAGHHPIHFPLLSEATPERFRARAFSFRGFLGSLGFAAPPAIVTAVITVPGLGWRHAIGLVGLLGAVYTVAMLAALYTLVGDEWMRALPREPTPPRRLGRRLRDAVRSLLDRPGILSLALLAMFSSTASWAFTSYVVILLTDGYRLPLDVANLSLTALFVASALMQLVGGGLTDRFSAGPVILASFGVVGVLILALSSLALLPWVALLVVIVVGGFRSLGGPAKSKLADEFSAATDLGRNFAIITVGTMIGSAVAPPLFGTVIEEVGLQAAFAATAGVTLLAGLLTVAILAAFPDG